MYLDNNNHVITAITPAELIEKLQALPQDEIILGLVLDGAFFTAVWDEMYAHTDLRLPPTMPDHIKYSVIGSIATRQASNNGDAMFATAVRVAARKFIDNYTS